eukprot:3771202-Rhodomonas_salina.2
MGRAANTHWQQSFYFPQSEPRRLKFRSAVITKCKHGVQFRAEPAMEVQTKACISGAPVLLLLAQYLLPVSTEVIANAPAPSQASACVTPSACASAAAPHPPRNSRTRAPRLHLVLQCANSCPPSRCRPELPPPSRPSRPGTKMLTPT